MPALLIPLLGFLVGAALAWPRSAEGLRRLAPTQAPALASVALLGLLVYAPATSYVVALAPDWAVSYLFAVERVTAPVRALLALAAAASVPLGYSALATARVGSSAWLRRTAPALLLALAAFMVGVPRLRVVGSHAQFQGGFGLRPLHESIVAPSLLLAAAATVAAALWTYQALHAAAAARGED